jgi:hypothetical protein
MKSIQRSAAVKWINLSWLLVAVCSGLGAHSPGAQVNSTPNRKISRDLRPQLPDAQTANMLPGDGIMIGDGHLIGDAVARAQSAMINVGHTSGLR